MNFKGKVVIVTGAGSGIGRATALKFAEFGGTVAALDIDDERAARAAAEIAESGGRAIHIQADITNYQQVREAAQKVKEAFGRIDVLANCAGWDKIELFMQNEPDLWDKLINVNLKGLIYCTRAVLEYMIQQRAGSIVNVSSDAGKVGSTGEAVYSAAKGGVISFTKSIAREMARYNIRVNCICPAPTDTPLFREVASTMPKVVEKIQKSIPLGRIARPEEQASAIVWLASEDASFITGQALSVNGGLNMV